MKKLPVIFILFLCSCQSKTIRYPQGGYDFVSPGIDTFFLQYPMKSVLSHRDSARIAGQSYFYCKAFDEPNISLRPAKSPIFRFSYESTNQLYFITLTPDNLTIKKWLSGHLFPEQGKKDTPKVTYSTQEIPISSSKFVALVNAINNSGYWNMPHEVVCGNLSYDSPGFGLEANTGFKYNSVSSTVCPDAITPFTKACFEILKCAKLENKINIGVH